MNKNIKRVFDPNGILNPGKMFVEIICGDILETSYKI